jgi:ParB family chromosome partitioning protein
MAQDDKILEIDIELLQPNPLQPRGLITPESLIELVDSIREHGILEPLVVAKTPAGYQIIAGERRWRGAKIAGFSKVPVIIRETTPQGMLEMAIVENVQRIDLNPLERALAYQRLLEEFALSTQEVARRVSKSPSYISNTMRLLGLPDALKDALVSGATTEGHARALASLEDPNLIVEAYKIILQKNLSVRGAEDLARKFRARVQKKNLSETMSQAHIISDELENMEKDLTEKFSKWGIKPIVKVSQSRVQARVTFILSGDTAKTGEAIEKIYKAISSVAD